jgi:cytochrome c peroxidase
MPEPAENPVTAEKAMLGKFLFWDEQMSSDNSTACGTCHLPSAGGSDSRSFHPFSLHAGPDGELSTADDIRGSVGMYPALESESGDAIVLLLEEKRQVTGRRSMSAIGAGYARTSFWDGRAGREFRDPQTDEVAIANRGNLENQAIGPILSATEMGHPGRDWDHVISKITPVVPLALALRIPREMRQHRNQHPDYPSMFNLAFGSPEITARRIAFAIATYERTLVPNETPFDSFAAGNEDALTQQERNGMDLVGRNCANCHSGSDFSDHRFHNTGVRPINEDLGRFAVTGNAADRGRFKTSSLRNSALRAPYFHNGGATTLADVVNFYNRGGDFHTNQARGVRPLGLSRGQRAAIVAFIDRGLTDPRVANASGPFTHPTLRRFFQRGDSNRDLSFDIADPIHVLLALFTGIEIECPDASDANDDGLIDVSDPVSMLARMFQAGEPLPLPGDRTIGPDPTPDGLGCAE